MGTSQSRPRLESQDPQDTDPEHRQPTESNGGAAIASLPLDSSSTSATTTPGQQASARSQPVSFTNPFQTFAELAHHLVEEDNLNTWNELPEDVQSDVLLELSGEIAANTTDDGSQVHEWRKLWSLLLQHAQDTIAQQFRLPNEDELWSTIQVLQSYDSTEQTTWDDIPEEGREIVLQDSNRLFATLVGHDREESQVLQQHLASLQDRHSSLVTRFSGKRRVESTPRQNNLGITYEEAKAQVFLDIAAASQTAIQRAAYYSENLLLWLELGLREQLAFLAVLREAYGSIKDTDEGKQALHLADVLHENAFQNIRDIHLARLANMDERVGKTDIQEDETPKYWPPPSYDRPEDESMIDWKIHFWDPRENWDSLEAMRRFNTAVNDHRLAWEHLPREVALLVPLPRPAWPQLLDSNRQPVRDPRNERNMSNIPIIPRPYPLEVKSFTGGWSTLKEVLLGIYGVDEGDIANHVDDNEGSKSDGKPRSRQNIRNTIRKRMADKKMKLRVLGEVSAASRKNRAGEDSATLISRRIVEGTVEVRNSHGPVQPPRLRQEHDRLTDEQLLFNTTWNIDIWRGTMTQPGSNANTHPLPLPQEIGPALREILQVLGRRVPTLNWLYSTYPHLRPQDVQVTGPSAVVQIIDPVLPAQDSVNFEEGLALALRAELDRMDRANSSSQQLVDIGHPANPEANNSWPVGPTNTHTGVPQREEENNERPESEVEDGQDERNEQSEG